MKFIKILFIFFLVQLCSHLNAQDFIIGVKYGNGKGSFKRVSNSAHTADSRINQYGISLAYSPYYSKFSLESSIEYEKSDLADYLYIPLGFRITLGKRLRPFLECGGYYSVLNTSHSAEDYMMKNDYGARFGLGLVFAADRKWRIEAGYYRQFGFGSPLVEKIQVPINTYVTEKNRFSAYNFELALKYRF